MSVVNFNKMESLCTLFVGLNAFITFLDSIEKSTQTRWTPAKIAIPGQLPSLINVI